MREWRYSTVSRNLLVGEYACGVLRWSFLRAIGDSCHVLVVSQLGPVLPASSHSRMLLLLYVLRTFTELTAFGALNAGRRVSHVVSLATLRLS